MQRSFALDLVRSRLLQEGDEDTDTFLQIVTSAAIITLLGAIVPYVAS